MAAGGGVRLPIESYKYLLETIGESHEAARQAFLALAENDKKGGGIYRLNQAAEMFQWCGERLKILAEQLEKGNESKNS